MSSRVGIELKQGGVHHGTRIPAWMLPINGDVSPFLALPQSLVIGSPRMWCLSWCYHPDPKRC
jgi:hypothetical protein